jgi:uncharacterized protein
MNPKFLEHRSDSRFGGGLFALVPYKKGEIVATFDGQIYEWNGDLRNLSNESPDYILDHAIQFAPGKSRDSEAGMGRLANHSCEPNCGIKNYFDIVAMRDIAAYEEITWDYAMTENNDWFMSCDCGSKRCRRLITGYRNLPLYWREEYRGFISQWLIDADIPFEGDAVPQDGSETIISLPSALITQSPKTVPLPRDHTKSRAV